MDGFMNGLSYSPIEVLALLVFGPILAVAIYNYYSVKRNPVEMQLKQLSKQDDGTLLEKTTRFASTILGRREEKIKLKLRRSNIDFKHQEYMLFMVAGVVAGFILGFSLLPFSSFFGGMVSWIGIMEIEWLAARILSGVVFAAAGYFVPELWIQYRIYKRRQYMVEQMGDALLNLADALRSGANMNEAIRITGEDMSYPLGDEFRITYQEVQTGKLLEHSLEDMKERVNIKDFTMAINSILIQIGTGGNMEPTLRNMVQIMAERKIIRKEMEKAVASSKMQGFVLMAAPIVFIVMFSSVNSEGYEGLFRSPLGIGIVVVAGISYFIGATAIMLIIKKLSKIV